MRVPTGWEVHFTDGLLAQLNFDEHEHEHDMNMNMNLFNHNNNSTDNYDIVQLNSCGC